MEIESVTHKTLRRYVETGNVKGLIEPVRLARMLTFILTAASFGELGTPPTYGFHPLVGDRAGTFAMTVTKNWRLTFTKVDDTTIADLDLEDYR